ncbi:MAG: hypothetical protein RIQ81_2542 [Pseudomonadota bacterium]
MLFTNRTDAGAKLGGRIKAVLPTDYPSPIILGIPRGGMEVAAAASQVSSFPYSFIVTRKLRTPNHPELAFGAVAEQGQPWLNDDVVASHGLDKETIEREVKIQRAECRRRREMLSRIFACPSLPGHSAIVVDDGMATGATMIAALKQARIEGAAKAVCAVPVCPDEMLTPLRSWCDQLVVLHHPAWFSAVGEFYEHFPQLEDADLERLARGQLGISQARTDRYHHSLRPGRPNQEKGP